MFQEESSGEKVQSRPTNCKHLLKFYVSYFIDHLFIGLLYVKSLADSSIFKSYFFLIWLLGTNTWIITVGNISMVPRHNCVFLKRETMQNVELTVCLSVLCWRQREYEIFVVIPFVKIYLILKFNSTGLGKRTTQ